MNLILHKDFQGETAKVVKHPNEYTGLQAGDVLVSANALARIEKYLKEKESNQTLRGVSWNHC